MHIVRGRVVLMLLINVKGHKTDVVVVVSAMHNMGMWPAGPHRNVHTTAFVMLNRINMATNAKIQTLYQ